MTFLSHFRRQECNFAYKLRNHHDYTMIYLSSASYNRVLEQRVGSYRSSSAPVLFTTRQPAALYTLESKVQTYTISTAPTAVIQQSVDLPQQKQYGNTSLSYFMPHQQEYFSPEPFLNPRRPVTQWIGDAAEVADLVAQTFTAVTGQALPHDLQINVVREAELFRLHAELSGAAAPGLQGFSLNRHGFGSSTIVVKQNDLDKLLLTIGHEIGHVLSFSLSNKLAEECKAFAFELAWMEAIVEQNIGDLALCINLNPLHPADNGLHDIAWQWVQRWRAAGMDGKEIFRQLCRNQLQPGEA